MNVVVHGQDLRLSGREFQMRGAAEEKRPVFPRVLRLGFNEKKHGT